MESHDYQDIFDKFKNGIFKYMIKNDVLRNFPYIDDIYLDEFHINSHTGKIYPLFIVKINKDKLSKHEHYLISNRNMQERIIKIIKRDLDRFYPTGEFVLITPNIYIKKV